MSLLVPLVLACSGSPTPGDGEGPPGGDPLPVPSAQAGPPARHVPSVAPPRAPEPGPDPATSTALVLIGDAGKGGAGQARVAAAVRDWCQARRCDFVAYLGDNLYPAGPSSVDDPIFVDRFERYWEGFDVPFRVALGNHDHLGDVQAEIAYSERSPRWRLPARWYRFEAGIAEFLVLDTGPEAGGGKLDAEQTKWLEEQLRQPKPVWRVAYGHHPIRSSGLHGNGPEMIAAVEPLLREGQVDFWLCGHDHDLEVLDDGVPPVEVVSGGGSEARKVNLPVEQSVYLAPSMGFGYLVLDADAARLAMVQVASSGEATIGFTSRWPAPRAARP